MLPPRLPPDPGRAGAGVRGPRGNMTTSTERTALRLRDNGQAAVEQRRFILPLGPSLERRRLQMYLTFMLGDAIAIVLAFAAVAVALAHSMFKGVPADAAVLAVPIYWTIALYMRVYTVKALITPRFAQLRAAYALFCTAATMALLAYLTHTPFTFGRAGLGFCMIAASVLLVALRSAMQPLVLSRCGPTAENVLIINDGGAPVRVPRAWIVDARAHNLRPDACDPHMLDRLGLFMTNMDRVLVTCPPERRAAWAMIFKGSNICGEIVDPDVQALGAVGARRSHGFGTLVVSIGPLSKQARAIKRAMDIAIALLALLFLLPLFVTVGALIRLEDGGPVFFRQQRQGRNNRLFWIYKFRSMRVLQADQAGTRSASRDDDRITRIGRLIRRTSIDELPQLINVLRGDMSVVGPRPHAIGSMAGNKRFWEVDPRYLLRHSLKPGLTGLAQVRGLRGATDTESDLTHRLQADLEYLDGWTVLRDLKIILSTIRVLVHHRAF